MDPSRSKEQGYEEVAATTASWNCETRQLSTQKQTHKEPCKYSALVLLEQQESLLGQKKFVHKENMNFSQEALILIREQIINIMPLAYKLCLDRENKSRFYKKKKKIIIPKTNWAN